MKQHSKKKTYWVNVYKYDDNTPIVGGVHNTKEEAMSTINWSLIYVDTVRINWEE